MRLLLVNPNMTTSLTERLTAVARSVVPSGVEIVPVTARRGFEYVASRAEAQISGAIAYEMIAENLERTDAIIIAAFGDPGLRGARELFDLPVIGMAEAAVMSAAMLGERFSIITFSPVMSRWYADSVTATGLSDRFTGVRTPDTHDHRVAEARDVLREELVALARSAVEKDGADVVILGGAPLAGLAKEVQAEIPAIVVDPISAAAVQAMALVSLTARAGLVGRASKPIGKTSVGLPEPLAAIISRQAGAGAWTAERTTQSEISQG